jgi:hypothetical protein
VTSASWDANPRGQLAADKPFEDSWQLGRTNALAVSVLMATALEQDPAHAMSRVISREIRKTHQALS